MNSSAISWVHHLCAYLVEVVGSYFLDKLTPAFGVLELLKFFRCNVTLQDIA